MRIIPNAQHISQFYGGHHGTCTQAAAAVCLAAALDTPTTQDTTVILMLKLVNDMATKGTFTDTGGSTVYNMAREIEANGAKILIEHDYNASSPILNLGDLQSVVLANAGIHPILLQIAAAHNLYDVNRVAEDQRVNYHAIALLGLDDDGDIIVSDSNNPTVTRDFDTYPWQAIENAAPCGMIMLDGPYIPSPVAPGPTPTPKQGEIYTVRPGDSLSKIATEAGLPDWDILYEANINVIGSDPNKIFAGQKLNIPFVNPNPAPPVKTYTVQPGDWLGKIAQDHGYTDWHTLYNANIKVIGPNPNLIKPGQVLVLP